MRVEKRPSGNLLVPMTAIGDGIIGDGMIEVSPGDPGYEAWFPFIQLGGPGSGNFGHAGRKGKVGGSAAKRGVGLPSGMYGDAIWGVSDNSEATKHIEKGLKGIFPLTSETIRSEVKSEIVDDIAERSDVDSEIVNKIVGQWSESSNDEDVRSLSLQEDAAEEFGVTLSSWQQGKVDEMATSREAILFKDKLEQEYFSREAEPGATQRELEVLIQSLDARWDAKYPELDMGFVSSGGEEWLKSSRFSSIAPSDIQRKVLRAMYNNTQEKLKDVSEIELYRGVMSGTPFPEGAVQPMIQNAVSSWSSSFAKAEMFGTLVVGMVVPKDRILSTARTGFGCLPEYEYTILGGNLDTARVVEKI